jgi:hypothetical protein
MNTVLKSVLIPLLLGGAIVPSAAHAQVELHIGPGGVDVQNRDRDRYVDPGYDRGPRRRCDPRDALDNARDAGFRRPQIIRETSRSITVQGFTRNGRSDRISFANVRGCPEI